ncbi:hypothetical protein HN499_05860 [archaeon]|jgi:hypothetical protein|nr:hypothetical protein [archaeon]
MTYNELLVEIQNMTPGNRNSRVSISDSSGEFVGAKLIHGTEGQTPFLYQWSPNEEEE